jgi:hypothetical protein
MLRAVLAVLSAALVIGGLASFASARPVPLATPSASLKPTLAPSVQLHNCPPTNRWSIAVWSGLDGLPTSEALATCREGAVSAAYTRDPDSQSWSRYFAGHPEISDLTILQPAQGVIALGADCHLCPDR